MAIRTLGPARCLLTELVATVVATGLAAALLSDLRDPGAVGTGAGTFASTLVRLCEWVLLGCVVWAWAATTAVVWEAVRLTGDPARPTRPGTSRGYPVRTRPPLPGVPRRWRRLVLTACGIALGVGAVAPAQATTGAVEPGAVATATAAPDGAGGSVGSPEALRGLPMPDRAAAPRTGEPDAQTVGPSQALGSPAAPPPTLTPSAPPASTPTTATSAPTPPPTTEPTASSPSALSRGSGAPASTSPPERRVVVSAGDTLWSLARADLPASLRSSHTAIGAHWRALHRLNLAVLGPDPDLIVPGQRLTLPPPPPH